MRFSQGSTFARIALSTAALALLATGSLQANDAEETTGAKSARRLPAHYAQLVNADQRAKIYDIQESYAPKIAELEAKLAALKAEADVAIRGVLTADQQKRLDELVAAARERRENRRREQQAATASADAT